MIFTSIHELFEPLLATLPCWAVKQGYGTFLTMEFGEPQQVVHDVLKSKGRPPSRVVAVHGHWHLWIQFCGWQISNDNTALASWESSPDAIAKACRTLDGQILTGVRLDTVAGSSRFTFDLGGVLETQPYEERLLEQWVLYCPDGNVFVYRSDGKGNYHSATGGDCESWVEVA